MLCLGKEAGVELRARSDRLQRLRERRDNDQLRRQPTDRAGHGVPTIVKRTGYGNCFAHHETARPVEKLDSLHECVCRPDDAACNPSFTCSAAFARAISASSRVEIALA